MRARRGHTWNMRRGRRPHSSAASFSTSDRRLVRKHTGQDRTGQDRLGRVPSHAIAAAIELAARSHVSTAGVPSSAAKLSSLITLPPQQDSSPEALSTNRGWFHTCARCRTAGTGTWRAPPRSSGRCARAPEPAARPSPGPRSERPCPLGAQVRRDRGGEAGEWHCRERE